MFDKAKSAILVPLADLKNTVGVALIIAIMAMVIAIAGVIRAH